MLEKDEGDSYEKSPMHVWAARTRDVVQLGVFGAMVLGFGWLLTDNTRVRAFWRDMAGVTELTELQRTTHEKVDGQLTMILERMDTMAHSLEAAMADRDAIRERLLRLEQESAVDKSPALRFMPQGNSITDGRRGDVVTVTVAFVKMRDCGRPSPDHFFMDSASTLFRFQDVSIVDEFGRGPGVPPSETPQTLKFTARIPKDAAIQLGGATGWVVLRDYERCPHNDAIHSPSMGFDILG